MKTIFTTLILLVTLNVFSQEIKVNYNSDYSLLSIKSDVKLDQVTFDTVEEKPVFLNKSYTYNKVVDLKQRKNITLNTKKLNVKKYLLIHLRSNNKTFTFVVNTKL